MVDILHTTLIIRFSSVGDIVLSSLLLRTLRARFPSLRLDYLVRDEYAGLVRFNPAQGDQAQLMEQLLHFPSPGVHDDGPDALEGAVGLLKNGGPNVW